MRHRADLANEGEVRHGGARVGSQLHAHTVEQSGLMAEHTELRNRVAIRGVDRLVRSIRQCIRPRGTPRLRFR